MKIEKMLQAEDARYAKIQRLTDLLCDREKKNMDVLLEEEMCESCNVGKRIKIDGKKIRIKNREYNPAELQKVTINTEGSMAIYDRDGRKLCGGISLNLSTENIEPFCLWVRKYHVYAEEVSGRHERIFQMFILVVAILAVVVYKALNILDY